MIPQVITGVVVGGMAPWGRGLWVIELHMTHNPRPQGAIRGLQSGSFTACR